MQKLIQRILIKKDWLSAIVIFLFNLILRLYRLGYPSALIGDEVYYVEAARAYLKGLPDPNIYHPPLGKMLIALGILFFGDNPFGWRIFSVFFGSLGILVLFFLTKKIFGSLTISFLASFLLCFDLFYLIQSRVGMLDIFLTFFVLSTCFFGWQYFKSPSFKNALFLGIFWGLGISVKLSGFFLIFLFVVWFAGLFSLSNIFRVESFNKKRILEMAVVFLTALAFYIFSFTYFFLKKGIKKWFFFQIQMAGVGIGGSFTPSHFGTPPLSWILAFQKLVYFLDPKKGIYILAATHPLMQIFLPISIFGIIHLTFKSKKTDFLYPLFCLLSLYLPWFLVGRITYFFYFLPCLPFVYIIEAFVLHKIWQRGFAGKIFVGGFLSLFLLFFLAYIPFLYA